MVDRRKAALSYIEAHRERFLTDLTSFLSIPSISTQSEYAPQVEACAEWAVKHLQTIGFDRAQTVPTAGAPVVYAELMSGGAEAPTLMLYGHYDVQPVDPLDLWDTDPFVAEARGENLYGRGATDMKGQILAALNAVEALKQTGGLPVNLRVVLEGEEEIGSLHFGSFVRDHGELLKADVCLNPDAGMLAADCPTITYSLRGLAYFELWVRGPKQDLHSGEFGGTVRNPAEELARLLGGMHDQEGRITLPGFYDSVRPMDQAERDELARLPQDDQEFLNQSGVPALWGESGYTSVERMGGRPTLEVNGLLSGFTGEGSKTVLPASAMAKVSMRLVADQDPNSVEEQLRAYLEINAPNTITWDLKRLAGGVPSITSRDSAAARAMTRAMETVWGVRPVFARGGGTIGAVGDLQAINLDSLLIGFALPDDNMHSPNEKLHLPTWNKGIQALVHFFSNLGGLE